MKMHKHFARLTVLFFVLTLISGHMKNNFMSRMLKCARNTEVFLKLKEKIGLFAAGCSVGTAGIKVLGSKDAKKVYTETTVLAWRAKERVMTTVTTIKENANDILTDAKEINEQRATDAAGEVIEDRACACTEETASAEESTEA